MAFCLQKKWNMGCVIAPNKTHEDTMSRLGIKTSHHFNLTIKLFLKRILNLIQQPVFIMLTIFGNLVIITSAVILYHLELNINPQITSLLDTLWWATSTVTTVGYGDVIPITPPGRIIGIFTMIFSKSDGFRICPSVRTR